MRPGVGVVGALSTAAILLRPDRGVNGPPVAAPEAALSDGYHSRNSHYLRTMELLATDRAAMLARSYRATGNTENAKKYAEMAR